MKVGKVNEWFNPACFTLPAPGTLGNVGQDTVIGPKFLDADFSVLKDTTLHESVRLQFRAEFFNILNHTNFGLPSQTASPLFAAGGTTTNGDLSTYTGRIPTAGQITTQAGTPRQIQFALKLIF